MASRLRVRKAGVLAFVATDIRRFTARLAEKIELACKLRAPVGDSGRLVRTIAKRPVTVRGRHARVRIVARAPYSLYVEAGTGIYGPTGRRIYPKRSKVLVFRPSGSARFVFAKSVRGQPGQHFMRDGLVAVISKI
jgi:hypothetical protein